MIKHFGERHKIVSPVLWDTFLHDGDLHGYVIKLIGFYPSGYLMSDEHKDEFGFYTEKDGNNLFLTHKDACYAVQLLAAGSDDPNETFLVMKVTSNEAHRDVRMQPCGPMFSCGRRI